MLEEYRKLRELVVSIEKDVEKAAKGNRSAGVRVRKICQETKAQAQTLRLATKAAVEEAKADAATTA